MKPMTKRAGIRTGSQPIVAVIDPGLLRKERIRIPLWLILTGLTLRMLARVTVLLVRLGCPVLARAP